jgi:molybdopterin converting factor small subunit
VFCTGKRKRNIKSPVTSNPRGTLRAKEALEMKVKIQYLGLVKSYTNRSQDELYFKEGTPLSELLDKLAAIFGKPFNPEVYEPSKKDVKPTFVVMVNGVLMGQLNGVGTQLKDGDSIIVMPLMTGG